MEVPLLGRRYAYDILRLLQERKCTFTRLWTKLAISKTTLSTTLQDLVEEGLVSKKAIGQYTVYRLTEKGNKVLSKYPHDEDAILNRLTNYVLEKLEDQGYLDKYSDMQLEEVSQNIREKAKQALAEMTKTFEETLRGSE